jgi:hypothetical protein
VLLGVAAGQQAAAQAPNAGLPLAGYGTGVVLGGRPADLVGRLRDHASDEHPE